MESLLPGLGITCEDMGAYTIYMSSGLWEKVTSEMFRESLGEDRLHWEDSWTEDTGRSPRRKRKE